MSQNHDFDWVMERSKCSVAIEFFELRELADKNATLRSRQVSSTNIGFQVLVTPGNNNQFVVRRFGENSDAQIAFNLNSDHILIVDPVNNREFKVTVGLNDDGECRFRVNGEGEFQLWHVLKKALDGLFFDVVAKAETR